MLTNEDIDGLILIVKIARNFIEIDKMFVRKHEADYMELGPYNGYIETDAIFENMLLLDDIIVENDDEEAARKKFDQGVTLFIKNKMFEYNETKTEVKHIGYPLSSLIENITREIAKL